MRQRPAACLALLVFLILQILPAGLFLKSPQATEKCEVQVTGRVSRQIQREDKTQIYLTDCQVRNEKLQFETKKLLIYLSDTTEYPVGTDLSLSGTIYPVEEPTNPGQFNSRLYYAGQGIDFTVYAEQAAISGTHAAPVRETLSGIQKKIGQVYENVLSERDSSLLRAMVLGEKTELDVQTKEFYQRNGISHLLAISGLHVSLIGMGLYRFLRRLTGSYAAAAVPSALFLWAYAWMTGGSLSTVRAAVMCSFAILAELTGRTSDMLTSMGISALILMLMNPLSARQSAFLLSYGAVLAIGLIQPLWKLYGKKKNPLKESLSVSISILIVTFPLLLCFFYEYPLYSTLLNLIAIPLMSVLMACALACGLIGLFSLPAAALAGVPCHLVLSAYEWAGSRCLALPGAVLTIGEPETWKVLVYYTAAACGILLLYREKRRKKYWRKREAFCPSRKILAGSAGILAVCVCLLCVKIHTGFTAEMLDVGQGDSIFFQSPSGTTFLYDGGSTGVKSVGAYRILPYLQSEGVGTLDYMLISHMDQDHISGLKELIEDSQSMGGIRIGQAVLPDLAGKDDAYLEMEELLKNAEIPILYMGAGDRLTEGKFSIQCFWPDREAVSSDRNDLSMVLLAEYQDFQMLLTGDIGEAAEAKLCASGFLEPVEILKTAHHGSRYSSTAEFLEMVKPSVSLISCGAGNRYGHPGEETLQRLSDEGSRIRTTMDSGAIRVWTDGRLVKVRGFVSTGQ